MKAQFLTLLLMILILLAGCRSGHKYYVSSGGSDENPGTRNKPFLTIAKASGVMTAGDICYVMGGNYRETITILKPGQPGKPIRFEAYQDEKPVIDGTDPVEGEWALFKDKIFMVKVTGSFEQLFYDGVMMVEARWPDMKFPDQLWERSCWAGANAGSRYGKMVDNELSAMNIDWTGAIAVLNVAHQFNTWTREVLSYDKENNAFTYNKDIQPITSYADATKPWEDDQYYLFGKLDALDSPGEWYLDQTNLELYFWSPDGNMPDGGKVAYKSRDYGIDVSGKDYLEISGFEFFGTTFRIENCNHCLIENCNLIYPAFSREFNDPSQDKTPAETMISGDSNIFMNNDLAFSQTTGITIIGSGNLVTDNIIHDVAWNGQGFALSVGTSTDAGNKVIRNTAYNTGYSVLAIGGFGNWEVGYNHFYNAALVSKDCAVIQTGNWNIRGSVIHHNWIHDCYAMGNHPGGLKGGLGIRGDDQTRAITVHHNVVWNCGRDGIIVKGDTNQVYNNTVFNIGSNGLEGNYISLHTEPEPYKPWRKQAPLLEIQNLSSLIINNAAFNITGDRQRTPFTPSENLVTNYLGKDFNLSDPDHYDFTPKPGSPLIDAGTILPGFTDGFKGELPDIGAYEYGGDAWKAGAER